METTFIYSLSDPITNEIRYIGKSNDLRKRLYAHIKECKSEMRSHKISWVRSLLNKNQRPIIEIIDEVPSSEWEFWESFWISQFLSWGIRLVNISPGGYNNNYKRDFITRDKMKKSKLGTHLSDEHKENISSSIKQKSLENKIIYTNEL